MKWTETITPKQAAEELGVPYHGWMREMDRAWISEDQKYSVMSRLLRTEWGKVEHVTITAAEGVGRSDGSGDIPWAVKMEIKNDLFGEKRVAVEVFPTQDRLVDVCDCYHLWVFEKGFQLPFGIHPGYGWHITELKIYDVPRPIRDFMCPCAKRYADADGKWRCKNADKMKNKNGSFENDGCICTDLDRLSRPPQSWCYVEDAECTS